MGSPGVTPKTSVDTMPRSATAAAIPRTVGASRKRSRRPVRSFSRSRRPVWDQLREWHDGYQQGVRSDLRCPDHEIGDVARCLRMHPASYQLLIGTYRGG